MKKVTILLSIVFGLFLFSPNLIAQGETCETAEAVVVGTHVADGPSSGSGIANICYSSGTHADWYYFTATGDGDVQVTSTNDPNLIDTRVSIYTGTCNDLTCHAFDDDSGDGFTSDVTFCVNEGVTYYIEWDDRWSEEGFEWELSYTPGEPCPVPPANDECETAEAIGEVVDQPFNTEYATTSGVGGHFINQDIWYVYTATGDGTIDVDLCGSSYDTKLAVWDGCEGNELAYNDDGCYGKALQSNVEDVEVANGQDYFIQVGGYGSGAGEGVITLIFTEAPQTGDLAGYVFNNNTFNPVFPAEVEVSNESKDTWIANTDEFGEFLLQDLPYGLFDILVTADDYYPTMEDVEVIGGEVVFIEIPLSPVAPGLLVAQYEYQKVTLEWEKIPEGAPMDNITGTSITANTELYEPGQTLDIDFSFIYSSEDFEFICGFFLDFPDGVTVNSASNLDGNLGSSYSAFKSGITWVM